MALKKCGGPLEPQSSDDPLHDRSGRIVPVKASGAVDLVVSRGEAVFVANLVGLR